MPPLGACQGPRGLLFKFWDLGIHNFSTDEARLSVFSLLDSKYYIRDDEWPQMGRGQDYVSYFWSNGTDTRVPQNVFLVSYDFVCVCMSIAAPVVAVVSYEWMNGDFYFHVIKNLLKVTLVLHTQITKKIKT